MRKNALRALRAIQRIPEHGRVTGSSPRPTHPSATRPATASGLETRTSMLKFAVYDHHENPPRVPDDWPLHHAHLVGNDDIGMQAEIQYEDGIIECDKRSLDPAGLVLLIDVDEFGMIILRTCLLPDRDEPYLLHLELARHRIKTFLVKLEDWMLCSMESDHPIMAEWDAAREKLADAILIEKSNPAEADRLGHEALKMGIEASERLAMMHSDLLLAKRLANGAMPQNAFGCRIHQSKFAPPLAQTVSQQFDFVSIPIRWREIEPEEGRYDWVKFDKWMEWAAKSGCPVVAGPIIDFRPLAVPEWLYVWEHDYDTTHDLLHEHIEAIVRRYRKVVSVWNVASALHINDNFTLAYDQLMDVTRMATSLVKSIHPNARTMIEIADPFGEYFSANPKSIPPIVYAETIAQSGFKVDLIGLALQIGHHRMGCGTRDLMQVSSILDELLFLDIPVAVSAMSAPSHRADRDEVDPAGYWHESWNPDIQAEFLEKLVAICLSKPFVESVCIHELYDHVASELPGSGLITATGRGKVALGQMRDVHQQIQSGAIRCSRPAERIWSEAEELSSEADFAG